MTGLKHSDPTIKSTGLVVHYQREGPKVSPNARKVVLFSAYRV